MSHWYRSGKLFDKNHPDWQKLPGWPVLKSGKPRGTLNDKLRMHLGIAPSVTTILGGVGSKDGLMGWVGKLGIQAGLEAAQEAAEGAREDFARRRLTEMRNEASTRGTAFHEALERFCLTGEIPVDEAMRTACGEIALLPDFDKGMKEWVCEGMSNTGVTYAGTIDHHHGDLIRDWKTVIKDRDPRLSEIAQVAAYARAVGATEAENVYISQETGRILSVRRWTKDELSWGWEYFCGACEMFAIELNAPEIKRRK